MSKYITINTATDNQKDVENIQKILLDEKLAACIQVSEIISYYNWNNERCKTKEYLLTIKCHLSCFCPQFIVHFMDQFNPHLIL